MSKQANTTYVTEGVYSRQVTGYLDEATEEVRARLLAAFSRIAADPNPEGPDRFAAPLDASGNLRVVVDLSEPDHVIAYCDVDGGAHLCYLVVLPYDVQAIRQEAARAARVSEHPRGDQDAL